MNLAHYNMVEQQIRPWNVHSPQLLEAISTTDRAQFVPSNQQALCCADTEIVLDDGNKMLEPKVAARLVQALSLHRDDRVLLVGVGSGYTATLCAKLAYTVDCIDINQAVLDQAADNTDKLGIDNIHYQALKRLDQLGVDKEYDAILVRQARATEPKAYFSHLSSGGRCVALVGKGRVLEMMRYHRQGKEINAESIIDILRRNDHSTSKQAFVF